MSNRLVVRKNSQWLDSKIPFITVVTPVFNRRQTIVRTMESVKNQTFKDIEYIIVDDGSTEVVDDLVNTFMESVDFPVMFVKKTNGGVHTARNIGHQYARGKLTICIDSDDELLPNACETFYKVWFSIPENKRMNYWQIKAQCVDQNGKLVSALFPDNINEISNEKARKNFSMARGEQLSCRVTKVMRENQFPEIDGVTFVSENIRWIPLEREYSSWGINDVLRIYHTEGNDHLSKWQKRKNEQEFKNLIWNTAYMLNGSKTFDCGLKWRIKNVCKYCMASYMLSKYSAKDHQENVIFVNNNALVGVGNIILKMLLYLPSIVLSKKLYT